MFDSEDLLSESVFLLVDSGSRKILVWLGAEFMEDEGSDGEGGGADVAKRIADEACAAVRLRPHSPAQGQRGAAPLWRHDLCSIGFILRL